MLQPVEHVMGPRTAPFVVDLCRSLRERPSATVQNRAGLGNSTFGSLLTALGLNDPGAQRNHIAHLGTDCKKGESVAVMQGLTRPELTVRAAVGGQ